MLPIVSNNGHNLALPERDRCVLSEVRMSGMMVTDSSIERLRECRFNSS